jgi:talin
MRRLQAAGNAVKKATENLVRAAQHAINHEEEQSIVLSKRRVSGIAQEISFREAILKKERELEEARQKLAAVRRAKYNTKQTRQETAHNQYEYHNISNSVQSS